jgi:hypothetical protein
LAQLKSENEILIDAVKRNSDQLNDYKEKANLYEMNAQNYKEEIENLEKEKEDFILEQNELQVQLYNQRSKVSELELHKAELEKNFKAQLNDLEEKLKSTKLVIMEKDLKIQKQKQEIEELNEDMQTKINLQLHHQSHFINSEPKKDLIAEHELQLSILNEEILNINVKLLVFFLKLFGFL